MTPNRRRGSRPLAVIEEHTHTLQWMSSDLPYKIPNLEHSRLLLSDLLPMEEGQRRPGATTALLLSRFQSHRINLEPHVSVIEERRFCEDRHMLRPKWSIGLALFLRETLTSYHGFDALTAREGPIQ